MALKAVHVSDVPCLDHVQENPSLALFSTPFSNGLEFGREVKFEAPKFVVIGHRGNGMNALQSTDRRMKAFKENTIASFNAASIFPIHYIEFDVQVTKDDFPIIFHDDFIFSEDEATVYEKRVTDMNLSEFLSYGHQREQNKQGKPLLRKNKDGTIVRWNVETDDYLCTLEEAFEKVNPSLGFNIELKFDDKIVYQKEHLGHVLDAVLNVVFGHARDRPIVFSSFQPDAIQLVRKLQNRYPVFFLTNAGNEIYHDERRNTLEEALKVCVEGGLQGIVSEVRGIFRNPGAVNKIKEANLSLLTYGKLNNVSEAVYMQHLMGVEGVIVDFVQEISEAVSNMLKPSSKEESEEMKLLQGEENFKVEAKPQFSQRELSFLLKLIPELIHNNDKNFTNYANEYA